jgi:hypothetical protein
MVTLYKQIYLVENGSTIGQHKQVADRGFVSAYVCQVLVFPDPCNTSLSVFVCVVLLFMRLQTH